MNIIEEKLYIFFVYFQTNLNELILLLFSFLDFVDFLKRKDFSNSFKIVNEVGEKDVALRVIKN